MSRMELISVDPLHNHESNGKGSVEVVLLEPRPFRPFKSSEEYLIAMKEDLAEWLHRLYYPHLEIDSENFMDKLEDGIILCKVLDDHFSWLDDFISFFLLIEGEKRVWKR